MPVTSESDLSTPQARRRANTDTRLREALGVLAKDPSTAPTVAGLARAAGVGRNIIYTHHAGVLGALRELQSQREGATETAAGEADGMAEPGWGGIWAKLPLPPSSARIVASTFDATALVSL